MLDMILVPEGETARAFEVGLALDREYPMQTALGVTTPVVIVPTTTGPPSLVPPAGFFIWMPRICYSPVCGQSAGWSRRRISPSAGVQSIRRSGRASPR